MIKASEAIASLAFFYLFFFILAGKSKLSRIYYLPISELPIPLLLENFVLEIRKLFPLKLTQIIIFSLMNLFFTVESYTGAGWKKVEGSKQLTAEDI
jgi:hypothetical protein